MAVWLVAWTKPAYGLSRVFLALAAVVAVLLVVIVIFASSAARHLWRDELVQFRRGARDKARP